MSGIFEGAQKLPLISWIPSTNLNYRLSTKKTQKLLRQKLGPILPRVYEVGNWFFE